MRLRQMLSWLLVSLLLILTGRPALAATDYQLRVTGVYVREGLIGFKVEDGATINRLSTGVQINFDNGPAYPATSGWFEVRDSQGRDPGWTPEQYGSAPYLTLLTGATTEHPLPPNETYRVTIKSGPDGVRGYSTQLAEDYVFTLKTEGTEWSITGVTAIQDRVINARVPVTADAVIDQGVEALSLQTTKPVDPASLEGNVTLVDGEGRALDWTPSAKDGLMLNKGTALQPEQTYTLLVKGGPDGVRSILGDPLPQDYSLTFRTTAGALKLLSAKTIWPGSNLTDLPTEIRRDTLQFSFSFDRNLDCSTLAEAMQVTDSNGAPVTWQVECRSNYVTLTIPRFAPGATTNALPPGETYTFQFKGAVLQSTGGTRLEADVVRTTTTAETAIKIGYWQNNPYNGPEMNAKQTEFYRFWAEAGTFKIQIDPISAETPVQVVLQDLATGEYLVNEWASGYYSKSLTLPKTGSYDLILGPNYLRNLWIEGMELNMSLERPVLQLPAMAPFATKNQAFSVTASLLDAAMASNLELWLNDEKLASLTPAEGKSSLSVTIDPTTLADGIYHLAGYADGNANENAVLQSRSFLVDRADTYSDVGRTQWARPYIEVMSHLKILAGGGDGLFNPGRPVRRDEFAKMLAATLGLKATNTSARPFVDMKGDWSEPYLQAVYEAGYMQGTVVDGKRYFYPEKTISRAEAAVTLARVLGADQVDITGYVSSLKDWKDVPTWAKPSVAVLTEMKWLNGFPDGTFGPLKSLNRDQSAKVLANFLGMQ